MYRKGKPRTKKEKHKTKYHKVVPGRKKDYIKDKPHNKQTKEYSKEEKGDAFARMLAARATKFEKIKKKHEYQKYQEYLKAKQVYFASIQEYQKPRKKEASNLKAILEDSKEEIQFFLKRNLYTIQNLLPNNYTL
ncbi:6376_t:CDS:2 [Gigaspora margarita]|uniref:6376_t:CDS:1 n=1 Tax=Gigaspora margarita TaxID=4874 RepID=A0ABN7VKN1_GIGMA|nr:6376_t:CDS:2 [Gigaspora margarita]